MCSDKLVALVPQEILAPSFEGSWKEPYNIKSGCIYVTKLFIASTNLETEAKITLFQNQNRWYGLYPMLRNER